MDGHLASSPASLVSVCLLLALCAYLPTVTCYGSGAPTKACGNLQPGHSGKQSSSAPYTIDVSGYESYTPGFPLYFQVKGADYRGILIQARRTDGSTTPVGSFMESPSNTQRITCSNSRDSVTHSNTIIKSENVAQRFKWNPPSGNVGSIKFVATIAESKNKYWMDIESGELPYSSSPTTPKQTTTTPGTTPGGTAPPGTGAGTPTPSPPSSSSFPGSPLSRTVSSTATTSTPSSSTASSTTPSLNVPLTSTKGATSKASLTILDMQCLCFILVIWIIQGFMRKS